MSFAEQRASMAEDLERLEGLLRQAQEMARALEDRITAAAAAGDTETLADDAALARAWRRPAGPRGCGRAHPHRARDEGQPYEWLAVVQSAKR